MGDRLRLATSFTDTVLIHLATAVDPDVRVVFLDTGFHFAETLDTMRPFPSRPTESTILEMSDVLLFHHALGVTSGIRAIADDLRAEGHQVSVPDLFDGATFDTIEAGAAHAGEIGFDTITERGAATAAGLADPLVVVGFSLGVLPAQKLAQTHPAVVGAVLCHGAVPTSMFGDGWPETVPVQVHLVEDDPFAEEDLDAARGLTEAAHGELFLYPGSGHLVTDDSSADHDPVTGPQILNRLTAFVSQRLEDPGRIPTE